MAHEIMISYSLQDAPIAERVRTYLEDNGFSCWTAGRDVLEGEDFRAAIARAIQGCRVMVLVFSSAANTSRQIIRELKLADDANRAVVPLRIEKIVAAGNFAYFLGAAQWVEAIGGPNTELLQRLDAALRRYVGRGENATGGPSPSRCQRRQIGRVRGTVLGRRRLNRRKRKVSGGGYGLVTHISLWD